jgi:Phosphatidylserine/phosphatidylglycerophosphate/cardiolipin synthases and related enzymes
VSLVEALKRAAGRGVECRLLVDALGSKAFLKKDAAALREAGVRIVEALPLGGLLNRTKITARFDLRNHRKLAVIDGEVGYMGSHNVTDPTYGGKARGVAWHDLSLRLEGPVVSQLEGVFLEDWFVETEEVPSNSRVRAAVPKLGEFVLQTVPSGPAYATENFQRLVLSALFEARERVVITTPYLIPDDGLLQALEVAVLNGARVDLIVPEKVDQLLVGNAARAYYSRLLEMGVSLFLYQPRDPPRQDDDRGRHSGLLRVEQLRYPFLCPELRAEHDPLRSPGDPCPPRDPGTLPGAFP